VTIARARVVRTPRLRDAAQKIGCRNVFSLAGGYKALVAAGWPMKAG
jgi:hypothetical protein